MTDFTPPERIYLQAVDISHTPALRLQDCTLWHNRENDTDTEYIRADLVEAAKRQGAIEALEELYRDIGPDYLDPTGELADKIFEMINFYKNND